MKCYYYIQAIVTNKSIGSPGAIKFRHKKILAASSDAAYLEGQRWAARYTYKPLEETVNDYVVPLSSAKRIL